VEAADLGLMSKQLLLVEDDDAIVDALRIHLEASGYLVTREADGLQAIKAIGRQSWDMVLLDLMLPGVDGWTVCRHLREHHPDVPVIMLSAHSAEAHRIQGLELGADDYLAKPFSMLELVARVRALLRRTERLIAASNAINPSNAFSFGNFHLNPVRRELLCGQECVPLTLREYDLLHFLVRHPGRAFSRGDLLQNVWGEAFDGYEHTVNSHINRLRNKIEADPRDPGRIVTVWGIGYRFEADRQVGAA
jgi:DNA-binding response OmpR family regulator